MAENMKGNEKRNVKGTVEYKFGSTVIDFESGQIVKNVCDFIKEFTEEDKVTYFVNKWLDSEYARRDNTVIYPKEMHEILKNNPYIKVMDEMHCARSDGYYDTGSMDHFLDGDILWFVFTESNVYYNNIEYADDIYIVYSEVIFSNNTLFSKFRCRRLTEEYSEFLEQINHVTIDLFYGNVTGSKCETYYSDDGYYFHDIDIYGREYSEDSGEDESAMYPEDMVEYIKEFIKSYTDKGIDVRVESNSWGVTVMPLTSIYFITCFNYK